MSLQAAEQPVEKFLPGTVWDLLRGVGVGCRIQSWQLAGLCVVTLTGKLSLCAQAWHPAWNPHCIWAPQCPLQPSTPAAILPGKS